MEFTSLHQIDQLQSIDDASASTLQIIFKHSTRCSVSMMAKRMLEEELPQLVEQKMQVYYLDLLNHRNISNEIAARYQVTHDSPQLLFIKDGKCVYHASHEDVSIKAGLAMNA